MKSTRVLAAGGIVLLSLLWSLGPLRADLLPGASMKAAPALETLTLLLASTALAAAVWAGLRHHRWPRGQTAALNLAAGLGLFAGPALLVAAANGLVSSFTRLAVFALTPLFAVVFEPYAGSDAVKQPRAALAAALAASAGALLLFPLSLPASLGEQAACVGLVAAAAMIAAANCAAVRVAHEEDAAAPLIALACAPSACILAMAHAWVGETSWSLQALDFPWMLLVDLPSLVLLLGLMRGASATAMSARYLLAPLIAILVDMLIAPPALDLRSVTGLALMAGGAAWLIFAPEQSSEDGQSPLKLY